MSKNLSSHSTSSILQAGTVLFLAVIIVSSSFANSLVASGGTNRLSPPNIPSNPDPANNSINVSRNVHLTWTGGDPDNDTVTYNVFFGTNQTPPLVAKNISQATYTPGMLNLLTKYFWKIVAWDNHSNMTQGPLWAFTTRGKSPPNVPSDPHPANNSIGVPIHLNLTWTGGDPDNDTVTYNVFFGTNQTPPQVATNITKTSYNPGTLTLLTTYYWRIIAWDNTSNMTSGPLWKFTSRGNSPPNEPTAPSPENHSVDIPVNTALDWTGGDPDSDAVTYDVYLGTNQTPARIANNISTKPFSPGLLQSSTHYYWRIVAWDPFHASTTGPLWDFETIGVPENFTVKITKPLPDSLYVNDQLKRNLSGRCIVYGQITITAEPSNPEGIRRVDFYIDGVNVSSVNTAPYEYLWNPTVQFNGLSLKHNIKVVAIDKDGENATAQINVTKWKFHALLWLLMGAVILTTLIPHTTMKGLVLNVHQTGPRSYTFFAIRMHYHTVGLLKNLRGVVKWKRCVVHFVIPPTMIVTLGPPRTLAYLTIRFLGSNMGTLTHPSGGGFFQNIFPLREQGTDRRTLLSTLNKSVMDET